MRGKGFGNTKFREVAVGMGLLKLPLSFRYDKLILYVKVTAYEWNLHALWSLMHPNGKSQGYAKINGV